MKQMFNYKKFTALVMFLTISCNMIVAQISGTNLLWTSSTPTGEFYSNTPAVSPNGKYLYVLSNDYKLHCYDVANGQEQWVYDTSLLEGFTPTATYSTPSVDTDGTIYIAVANTDGRLFAINPDGTLKWVTLKDAEKGFWNKGVVANAGMRYGSPFFDDQYVYCGNGGATGSMVAFDKATGYRVGFLTDASGNNGPAGGIIQGPMINSDGMIYAMGSIYGMFGVHKNNMKYDNTFTPFAWQKLRTDLNTVGGGYTSGNQGSMAIDADGNAVVCLYTKNNKQTVICVKPDGSIKWVASIDATEKQDQGGVVIAADGTIYVALKNGVGKPGGIAAVDKNGTLKWRYEIAESVSGTPAVDKNGNIIFGTESGNIYIIDADKKQLDKIDVAAMIVGSDASFASEWDAGKAKIWCSPVIGINGIVYIGVNNTKNNKQNCVVALQSEHITGVSSMGWPMRGKGAQHSNRQQPVIDNPLVVDENADNTFTKGIHTTVEVRYTVKQGWNTIALPFDVTDLSIFGSGTKAYEFYGVDNDALNFRNIAVLHAGYPYIIYVETPVSGSVILNNVAINSVEAQTESYNGNVFHSTYVPVSVPAMEGKFGVTTEGRIQKGSNTASMKAMRAYFTLADGLSKEIHFYDDGIVTAVTKVNMIHTDAEVMYDITGMRINNHTDVGVVIKNGKKYLHK